MNFTEDIILENERAYLRPLKAADFDLLLPFSRNEPELWNYSLSPAGTDEEMKIYLDSALKSRAEQFGYPFVVFDKKTDQVAGSTRFYDISLHHQSLSIGYTWYGKAFHGTGLNKHCKFLLLQYAFEVLKMERVEFRADNNNKRSINAMKRIGCVEEGVLRSNCFSPNGRRDSIVLSILKEEWETRVKSNLRELIEK